MKKKYKKAEMDIIEFDTEDVITGSTPEDVITPEDGYEDDGEGETH